jgi:hypothetical protein
MKIFSALALTLLVPIMLAAQPGVPHNVELALGRIEQALKTGSPSSIEDMFPFAITMRLEDSLYTNASGIRAMELLKNYFAGKDSIEFNWLGRPGTGRLSYSIKGKRVEEYVDVWLKGSYGDVLLSAINISNYPYATVFMDIHPSKH